MRPNRRPFNDGSSNGLRAKKGYEGKPEKRQGVDVLHFRDGKIVQKLTYAKTMIGIDGESVQLTPETP